ncbi:DUF3515 domain-containing protein [Antrihabitans sp. YC2-6]|uniref:DUF3515 domain-containing protein n=1 Tax=Antrihabitans sp. YC2-6 TaxID=2799498 RepID=UPI0018F5ECEA|nr:DUF3515 domain-containing protein [Antrihabitans sp. YC2-6]MBJ8343398.1 DUF3515 domain-containing protein [Antrihabitans sp. YC2-6]
MRERHHPALIAAAIALPVALVFGVIVAAVLAKRLPDREPVSVAAVPAPAAGSPECTQLLPALPNEFGSYTDAELAEPAPPATKAWESSGGGDPIILRCGLDQPLEFVVGSSIEQVNGVQWFKPIAAVPGVSSSTYFAVDRGVYIALTVPMDSGPTPLQAVSDAVADTLPAREPTAIPLPN